MHFQIAVSNQLNLLSKRSLLAVIGAFAIITSISHSDLNHTVANDINQAQPQSPNSSHSSQGQEIHNITATIVPSATPAQDNESTPTTPTPTPTPHKPTDLPINIMQISYFPLDPTEQYINESITGDVSESYALVRQRTNSTSQNLVNLIKDITQPRYDQLSYGITLTPSITLRYEHTEAVPIDPISRRPKYYDILNQHHICHAVATQNIQEVWLWAYQGPTFPGSSHPYLNIDESKMSGPHGDISNSWGTNELPQCGKTYRVYTYNYKHGTAQAFHTWSHQIEAELRAVDKNMFTEFQGPLPSTQQITRCGSVHHPPNSRFDYDYENPAPQPSDCLDWSSGNGSSISHISCQLWGCHNISDLNNSHLNYLVWMWKKLPNSWWKVHADFDTAMNSQKSLLIE